MSKRKTGARPANFGNRKIDDVSTVLTPAEQAVAQFEAMDALFCAAMRKAPECRAEGVSTEAGTGTAYQSHPVFVVGVRSSLGWLA